MQCKKCSKRRRKDEPCLNCQRINQRNRSRSFNGVLCLRFRKLNFRTRKNNWPEIDFTKEEFFEWSKKSAFTELYKVWVASGFDKWLSPSLDRMNPNLPYFISNLRWVTWEENWKKGVFEDHRKDRYNEV